MRIYAPILFLLTFLLIISEDISAQIGLKIGITSSSFRYNDQPMEPYKGYDIDLSPYLGCDAALILT